LPDPQNVSVTLDTITRTVRALGKRVIIRVTTWGPSARSRAQARATYYSAAPLPRTKES
jgi:hypothetical protein